MSSVNFTSTSCASMSNVVQEESESLGIGLLSSTMQLLSLNSTPVADETKKRIHEDYKKVDEKLNSLISHYNGYIKSLTFRIKTMRDMHRADRNKSFGKSYFDIVGTRGQMIALKAQAIQKLEFIRSIASQIYELDKHMVTATGLISISPVDEAYYQASAVSKVADRYILKRWYVINGKKYITSKIFYVEKQPGTDMASWRAFMQAARKPAELIYSSIHDAVDAFLEKNEETELCHKDDSTIPESQESITEANSDATAICPDRKLCTLEVLIDRQLI